MPTNAENWQMSTAQRSKLGPARWVDMSKEELYGLKHHELITLAEYKPDKLLELSSGKLFSVLDSKPELILRFSQVQLREHLRDDDLAALRATASRNRRIPPEQIQRLFTRSPQTPRSDYGPPPAESRFREPVEPGETWFQGREEEIDTVEGDWDPDHAPDTKKARYPPQVRRRLPADDRQRARSADGRGAGPPPRYQDSPSSPRTGRLSAPSASSRNLRQPNHANEDFYGPDDRPRGRYQPDSHHRHVEGNYPHREERRPHRMTREEQTIHDLSQDIEEYKKREAEAGKTVTEFLSIWQSDFRLEDDQTPVDAMIEYGTELDTKMASTSEKLEKYKELLIIEEEKNTRLKDDLDAAKNDTTRLRSEFEEMKKQHREELEAQKSAWEGHLKAANKGFHEKKIALEAQLQAKEVTLKDLRAKFEVEKAQHVERLQVEVKSLRGALVDNSDDFRPIGDDMLKHKYEGLRHDILWLADSLATRPRKRADAHTDFNGYSRWEDVAGKVRTFFLQNVIWRELLKGFFSASFGLGALGPGEGRQTLAELCWTYRDLFDADSGEMGYNNHPDDYFIFHHDKQANKWRAITFQSFYMAAVRKTPPNSGLRSVQLFMKNRDNVEDAIWDALSQRHDNIPEDLRAKVAKIATDAGELALELGSQRALLELERVEEDVMINSSLGFVDCEDGDMHGNQDLRVAFMVSPKLLRVGDGRNDFKAMKTICNGQIYPVLE
ncbi:hypothetical protein OQA88_11222 [Cercophora sp. LCS_1]